MLHYMLHGFNVLHQEEMSIWMWIHWIGMLQMAPSLGKISIDTDNGLGTDGHVSCHAIITLQIQAMWKSEDLAFLKSILGTAAEDISLVYLCSVHSLPSTESHSATGMEGVMHSASISIY